VPRLVLRSFARLQADQRLRRTPPSPDAAQANQDRPGFFRVRRERVDVLTLLFHHHDLTLERPSGGAQIILAQFIARLMAQTFGDGATEEHAICVAC